MERYWITTFCLFNLLLIGFSDTNNQINYKENTENALKEKINFK